MATDPRYKMAALARQSGRWTILGREAAPGIESDMLRQLNEMEAKLAKHEARIDKALGLLRGWSTEGPLERVIARVRAALTGKEE